MEAGIVLTIFVALFILQWCFWVGLEIVNSRHLKRTRDKVPRSFEAFIDEDKLTRIRSYSMDNVRFGVFSKTLSDAILLSAILLGVLPYIDLHTLFGAHSPVFNGAVFFLVLILSVLALHLPLDYYHTFVIEERHGFNRTTLPLWIWDQVKGALVSVALAGLLILPLLWFIQRFPDSWWLWGFVVVTAIQFSVALLFPVVIAPLFNKFRPLEDQVLADKVEHLIRKVGLKTKGIFEMDAGKRSKHSNAYFTGLGKTKRIVLFDTLLESHSHEEILAVLAHEIGHYKGGHVIKMLLVSTATMFAGFYATYLLMGWGVLYEAFGIDHAQYYVALFLIGILWQRLGYFVRPLSMALSRKFERSADRYAVDLTQKVEPLANALKRLSSDNLSNLNPHPMYVRFNYSHPPVVERVATIESMRGTAG